MLRFTITAMKYDVPIGTSEIDKYNYWNASHVLYTERYCTLDSSWVWVNAVNDRIHLKFESATGATPNTWVTDGEGLMSGWSGGNYISLSNRNFGGGTDQTTNYWNRRFTFRTASSIGTFNDSDLATTSTTNRQAIYHIKTTGLNWWTSSNNMMRHDHLYSWDRYQNALFPAAVRTTQLQKGNYTYELPNKNGTMALTSDITANNAGAAPVNHASPSQTYGVASDVNYGHVRLSSTANTVGLSISGSGSMSVKPATTTTLGGVYVGSGINVSGGTISATAESVGAVKKVGDTMTGKLTAPQFEGKLTGTDTRNVNSPPSFYINGIAGQTNEFKNLYALDLTSVLTGDYCTLVTYNPWINESGGYPSQFAYASSDGIAYRRATSGTVWGAWERLDVVPPTTSSVIGGIINKTNVSGLTLANAPYTRITVTQAQYDGLASNIKAALFEANIRE